MSRNNPEPPHNALLGDLESIRAVLEDDDEGPAAANDDARPGPRTEQAAAHKDVMPAADEPDVPLLEDVVADAEETETEADDGPDLDDDALFQALLGDDWKRSAARLLDQARANIESHSAEWQPADTDELNDALKIRIDATLHAWLHGALAAHAEDLRRQLLDSISDELEQIVRRTFAGGQTSGHREDDDGQ